MKVKYTRRKSPLPLPASVVLDAFHAAFVKGKGDELKAALEEQGFVINVKPEIVNFAKQYIVDNNLHIDNEAAHEFAAGVSRRCHPQRTRF